MYFMNFTLVWSIGLHCELRIFLSYLANEYNGGMPPLRALEIVRNLQLSEVQENLLKYYRSLGAQLLVKYACAILKLDTPLPKSLKTAFQINHRFEFQSWVKVKVVAEVSEKWNKPNLMYIYHKQCNVKSCKNFNETAQMANFTDFPLISCGNGP